MRIDSCDLYDYVNSLKVNEKVSFKVFYNCMDIGETIEWDGIRFNWKPGTFDSSAFFNPDYSFEIIEEDKNINHLIMIDNNGYIHTPAGVWKGRKLDVSIVSILIELIDEINKLKESK